MNTMLRSWAGTVCAGALALGLSLGCSVGPKAVHAKTRAKQARAAAQRAKAMATLKTEEFMIPALDPGLQLYVRNKVQAGHDSFSPSKTVLFVHGATYPSEVTFDLEVGGSSWMDYVASHGYDVYLLDIRGYGRSTRPPSMAQPPEANPPFAHTEEAVRDIEAAVDFILSRRQIAALDLVGWSWGTTTTALYTTRHGEKVQKLALYAPVWVPPSLDEPQPVPTTAYRKVTLEDARQRWYRGVSEAKQASLIPAGWFDTWGHALLESDPEGAKQSPPVVRAPNGVLADILGEWLRGKRLYDASQIRVPTLIVKGEWDADTPAGMARGLFASLENAAYKSYVEIGEGTHMLMLEKNRMQLFRAVQAFLDDAAP
jgi:pimeloyl-ACP methyl ester carboxylesterase